MSINPRRINTFSTRLSTDSAKLLIAHARMDGLSPSVMLAKLAEEALYAPDRQTRLLARIHGISTPTKKPGQHDMSTVAEWVLKEIRRRGGNPSLEGRIEKAITDFRKKKNPPPKKLGL
jgi:hypothetical protein